jgi:hypothetical protein
LNIILIIKGSLCIVLERDFHRRGLSVKNSKLLTPTQKHFWRDILRACRNVNKERLNGERKEKKRGRQEVRKLNESKNL